MRLLSLDLSRECAEIVYEHVGALVPVARVAITGSVLGLAKTRQLAARG